MLKGNNKTSLFNGNFTPLVIGLMVFLISIFLSTEVLAEVEEVFAEVQPDGVEVGEILLYQVSVNGTGTMPTPNVNIPSSFQIVSGPNSNLNMQFTGGKMRSSKVISYRLRAMRKGDFTFPAPEVKVRRKVLKGNEVIVKVGASSTSPSTQSQSKSSRSNRNQKSTPGSSAPRGRAEPIFMKGEIEQREVYFQEPVNLVYTLYFQPSVQTYDLQQLPTTEGFWTEQWPIPNPPDVFRETIGGQRYNAAVIYRSILFPAKTGTLKIGEMESLIQYRDEQKRSRSIFDSFFDDQYNTKLVLVEPIEVKVKPLPEKGKPDGFKNIVGDYRVRAALDVNRIQANESVTLLVTISGEGNIGFIPEPEINIPVDIERYEPEITENHDVVDGVVKGQKTFTYLLIPRRAGKQTIPPVEIAVFNPKKKQYEILKTKQLELDVLAASGWTDTDNIPGGSPALVQTTGKDIRWIMRASSGLKPVGRPYHESFGYWVLYAIPLLILAGGFGARKRVQVVNEQQGQIRSKKAAKFAIKVLKQARDLKAKAELEEAYTALSKGITVYLSDRWAVPALELDTTRIRKELQGRSIAESTIAEIEDILNLCNSARFTPMGSDEKSLQSLLDRSERWIIGVDKSIQ